MMTQREREEAARALRDTDRRAARKPFQKLATEDDPATRANAAWLLEYCEDKDFVAAAARRIFERRTEW